MNEKIHEHLNWIRNTSVRYHYHNMLASYTSNFITRKKNATSNWLNIFFPGRAQIINDIQQKYWMNNNIFIPSLFNIFVVVVVVLCVCIFSIGVCIETKRVSIEHFCHIFPHQFDNINNVQYSYFVWMNIEYLGVLWRNLMFVSVTHTIFQKRNQNVPKKINPIIINWLII